MCQNNRLYDQEICRDLSWALSKVEQLQKQVEALTAGFQKVGAQLQLNKPAPQTMLNDQ